MLSVAFTAYSNVETIDEGVVISGVRWATRNVAAPGTFAANPEDVGQFYQWGRRRGWDATGSITGWNNSPSSGTNWTSQNDPCPEGWRIPTNDELRTLRAAGSEPASRNGVYGRLFGTAPNQIFLPATGWRLYRTGAFVGTGTNGYYWGNTRTGSGFSHYLGFIRNAVSLSGTNRPYGFAIRCVSDN